MCGVLGIRSFKNQVDLEVLKRMRDVMAHRGPDDKNIWVSGDGMVGLAHRRLAIIDLSPKAAQPMGNRNGNIWITYNGEVYNHLEIRAELISLGYEFVTDHSDTETVLLAYKEWGHDCVKKFRGMFAFGIWNESDKTLFLARDYFGIKPLYYGMSNGKFYFASEIKAILEDNSVKRYVNEKGLYDYLSFMCVPAPETLFDGIHKLPAGHFLVLHTDGRIELKRYWEVFDETVDLNKWSAEEISDRLLAELEESVEYHGLADVPVGIFLSGGIDSSCNAVLFEKVTNSTVKTFTTGFSDAPSYSNEFDYARKVALLIGAEHGEVVISPGMFKEFIPQLIEHQDEPIGDPVCVPLYFVSKLATDSGIKVCQVGEGSDEIFWGYPLWRQHFYLDRLSENKTVMLLLKCLRIFLGRKKFSYNWYYEIVRRVTEGEPSFWGGAEVFPGFLKRHLISDAYAKRLDGYDSYSVIKGFRDEFLNYKSPRDHLAWMTYVNLKLRLPELLLMRVDKMSMAVSLEARVPFLDKKVVSFALSIPEKIKTRRGELKHILKKATVKILPKDVIHRKKQGFGAPVRDFRQHGLGNVADEVIKEFLEEVDYFRSAQDVNLALSGNSAKYWYILNLALWHKRFIRNEKLIVS